MAFEIADIETAIPGSRTLPRRSTWELIQLSFFWIAINYHWAAIPIIILPSQLRVYLFLHHPAGLSGTALTNYIASSWPGTLALLVGPGLLVALLANPLFGYLSDRTRLRWGRRLPYILGGTFVNIIALGIMARAPSLLVLIGGLMLAQLGNNAAAAPFHALLPDLVSEQQRGKASGFMGLGQMLGSIVGATIPGLLFGLNAQQVINGSQSVASYQHTLDLVYGFTAVFIAVLAVATVLTVRERPPAERIAPVDSATGTNRERLVRDVVITVAGMGIAVAATVGILSLVGADLGNEVVQNVLILPAVLIGSIGVARAFDFRPRQDGDFAWVLVTRALVMMGIYTVLSFIQPFLVNVTFGGNSNKGETISGFFIDIVIVTAALSTAFAGTLSDRYGRKRMVYLSGAFMAVVGAIFVLTQLLLPGLAVPVTFASAAVFGLGYGSYVSVDWALVSDVLPSEAHYSRDMGIWNVALTAPQVLSYVIGAFVITAFAIGGPLYIAGHGTLGYTMLFVLLAVYATLGTVTVRFISKIKR